MIPVYEPLFQGNEKKYLQNAIDRGQVSQGYYVQRFEEEFAKWAKTQYAVAVDSGTAALETALWACCLKRKIIMPAATIISCAIAAHRCGASVGFYDIEKDLPVGDVGSLKEATCWDLDAIMRVHLFGHYSYIPKQLTIPVWDIHDCSQYWDDPLIFPEDATRCYSLYANKLITAGEGGIIATNSQMVADRARDYRNLCHTSTRFIHYAKSYNFRMSDIQAALALAQLEQIENFIEIKQRIRDWYKKYLPDEATFLADVRVPWMFLVSTKKPAQKITEALAADGIDTRRFFYPLNLQEELELGEAKVPLKNSERAWEHWFYLPSGLTLTESMVEAICRSLRNTLITTT